MKEYIVPWSRFRRELNKWMKKIQKEKIIVVITKNKTKFFYAVPHKDNRFKTAHEDVNPLMSTEELMKLTRNDS